MPTVLQKPAAAVARARMRQVFYKAEQDIIDEITRKRLAGYVDYAEVASLERVQQILTDMQDKVGEYMPKYIEKIFYDATEKDAAGYSNARSLTSTQINVEQQLVNNLMGSLMEAESVAFESAKQALTIGRLEESIFRESALHHVLESTSKGQSSRIAAKNMAIDLKQSGITAFVDKAGRKWSLTDYCDMCTRTTARQAQVAAALTADDWDLWQISSIGSTCKLCAAYEGRVYSKSGTNPDYPPLWAAFGKIDINGANDLANTYLNIHPSCQHSLLKYTTMGKTDEQIQRDKEFSSFEKRPADVDYRTRKQRDAYREKEQARAKLISDRNQWQRYREAFGDEIPSFEAFRRNKVNGTAKYEKWESQYRSLRAKGAEQVANIEKSGIIKNTQNEFVELLRKKNRRDIEPMPKTQLNKIVKAFKRQGGKIFMDADAQKYLDLRKASGATLDSKTIFLRKKPSRAEVFEEIIHATQYRNGEIKDVPKDIIIGEIKAKEKLLKYQKQYRLTDKEIKDTEELLAVYRKELSLYQD